MIIDVTEERLLVVSDLHLGNPASTATTRLLGFLDYAADIHASVCIEGTMSIRTSCLVTGALCALVLGTTAKLAADEPQSAHRLEADAHCAPRPALPVGQSVKARRRVREVVILGHRAVIPESTAFPKAAFGPEPRCRRRNASSEAGLAVGERLARGRRQP